MVLWARWMHDRTAVKDVAVVFVVGRVVVAVALVGVVASALATAEGGHRAGRCGGRGCSGGGCTELDNIDNRPDGAGKRRQVSREKEGRGRGGGYVGRRGGFYGRKVNLKKNKMFRTSASVIAEDEKQHQQPHHS